MAAFPPGYSDPNEYGTAFSFSQPEGAEVPPGTANYCNTAFTAQPTPEQPPPSYGFNTQSAVGQTTPSYGFNTQFMPSQPPPSYGQATQQMSGQPPPSYGQATQPAGQAQTINIQMDPNMTATMHAIVTMADPDNPATSENPVRMKCPSCQQEITTSTEYVNGSCSFLACLMCFFMGCLPLCWLPFIMTSFKDVIHTCPSCEAECGRFVRQNQSRGARVWRAGHGGHARRARDRRRQQRKRRQQRRRQRLHRRRRRRR